MNTIVRKEQLSDGVWLMEVRAPHITEESLASVYAHGDIVLGAATVILEMGEGHRAATSLNARLARK